MQLVKKRQNLDQLESDLLNLSIISDGLLTKPEPQCQNVAIPVERYPRGRKKDATLGAITKEQFEALQQGEPSCPTDSPAAASGSGVAVAAAGVSSPAGGGLSRGAVDPYSGNSLADQFNTFPREIRRTEARWENAERSMRGLGGSRSNLGGGGREEYSPYYLIDRDMERKARAPSKERSHHLRDNVYSQNSEMKHLLSALKSKRDRERESFESRIRSMTRSSEMQANELKRISQNQLELTRVCERLKKEAREFEMNWKIAERESNRKTAQLKSIMSTDETLRQDLMQTKRQLMYKEKELKERTCQLYKRDDELAHARLDLAELRRDINETRESLTLKSKALEELVSKYAECKSERDRAMDEACFSGRALAQTEIAMKDLQKTNEELTRKYRAHELQIADMKEVLHSTQCARECLEERVRLHQGAAVLAEKQKEQIAALEGEIKCLKDDLAISRADAYQCCGENEKRQRLMCEIQNEKLGIELELVNAQRKIRDLEAQLPPLIGHPITYTAKKQVHVDAAIYSTKAVLADKQPCDPRVLMGGEGATAEEEQRERPGPVNLAQVVQPMPRMATTPAADGRVTPLKITGPVLKKASFPVFTPSNVGGSRLQSPIQNLSPRWGGSYESSVVGITRKTVPSPSLRSNPTSGVEVSPVID